MVTTFSNAGSLLPAVALLAVHLLPRRAHVLRVLERQSAGVQCRRDRIRSLVEDGVAAVAVLRDHLSTRTRMLPIMTAEAPEICHVADIVRIHLPADAHCGKEVLPVLLGHFAGSGRDERLFRRGDV